MAVLKDVPAELESYVGFLGKVKNRVVSGDQAFPVQLMLFDDILIDISISHLVIKINWIPTPKTKSMKIAFGNTQLLCFDENMHL
jgi:hypothetical protein